MPIKLFRNSCHQMWLLKFIPNELLEDKAKVVGAGERILEIDGNFIEQFGQKARLIADKK